MPRVLIVGYGNPLRGDDGVGWQAAQRLARILGHEEVEVLAVQQLSLDLVEQLAKVDLAIFIDACHSETPGELTVQPLEAEGTGSFNFAHHLDPAGLLAYTQELYGKCPQALLVTLAGEAFDYGERLSPAVEEMMPLLFQRVEEAVSDFALHRSGSR